jgi:hypothetical protein
MVKDELLLVIEVGVLHLRGELVFKVANVEALYIFRNCYQVYLHVNYKFGSDLENETNDVSIRVFFFIFEEMLGWQQKVLWCSHIFLHSLIFWIENALHPLICNIFIQIWQFHPF